MHSFVKQINEVGNSRAMEYEGFQQSFRFLKMEDFSISFFVSDRHATIAKHMREKEPTTTHYFDLWQLKKSIIHLLLYVSIYSFIS